MTGNDFFPAPVKSLAEALGVSASWVTIYRPEEHRLNSLPFGLMVLLSKSTATTLKRSVVESCGIDHFKDKFVELFPSDPDLKPLNAVSYTEAPFLDSQGNLIGHVAAIDTKPMPREDDLYPIIELFSIRARFPPSRH